LIEEEKASDRYFDYAPNATVARSAAYSNYSWWAEREHFPKLGNRRFVEELQTRGFGTAKSNGVRLFKGLKLRPPRAIHVVSAAAAGGP
jgi:hypothetical protein